MKKWLKALLRRRTLADELPPLSGKVLEDEPLARKTWFGVGGPAEVYFEPADVPDLERLIRAFPNEPLTILGAGSNVLVLDGGVPGITVHLGKPFATVQVEGDRLICGAGVSVMEIARVAEKHHIAGFEFLSGIPGSLGGGIRMNAGAFGQSLSDRMINLTAMTANGDLTEINPREMTIFEYRKCYLPDNWIFLEAVLQGTLTDNVDGIRQKTAEYKQRREAAQPQGVRTAGSTFKNPDGLMAWKLIDKAGLRGTRVGHARVSDKHANFLINEGGASARDIEALGEIIRRKVWDEQGVHLEWEVKKLGVRKG